MTALPDASIPPEPPDPRRAARRRDRHQLARRGLMTTFGATLTRVTHGEVEIAMLVERVTQQHGFFHGGAVGALADSACGYAALSVVGEGEAGLTAEYKINLLSPAQGERLVAVGRVVKPGRTLIVARATFSPRAAGGARLWRPC